MYYNRPNTAVGPPVNYKIKTQNDKSEVCNLRLCLDTFVYDRSSTPRRGARRGANSKRVVWRAVTVVKLIKTEE